MEVQPKQVKAAGRLDRILTSLDGFVLTLSENSHVVALSLFVSGLFLAVVSVLIDVHSVPFDGTLRGPVGLVEPVKIGSPIDGVTIVEKEVGYAYAPNWLWTGVFLLPYAVDQLLKTRLAIEPLIGRLIERRMLVTTDYNPPDFGAVKELWRRRSRVVLPLCAAIFAVVFFFVAIVDFPFVVAKWTIAEPAELEVLAKGVTLHHDQYEFDWSVAAAFANPRVEPLENVLFAGVAYFIIAACGAGFLFAGFLFFVSFGMFFTTSHLRSIGLLLIPDLQSTDKKRRLGFEVFRDFFNPFIQAALATSTIALAMHLQNVYLRAPTQENIFNMVFGPQDKIAEILNSLVTFDFSGLFSGLTELFALAFSENINDLSNGALANVNPQTFAAAIALILIISIVFAYVWKVLNASAQHGRAELRQHGRSMQTGEPIEEEDNKRLDRMSVWPLGWIGMNQMLALIVIIAFAMWYPRLLNIVVAFAVVMAAAVLTNYVKNSVKEPLTSAWSWFIRLFRE